MPSLVSRESKNIGEESKKADGLPQLHLQKRKQIFGACWPRNQNGLLEDSIAVDALQKCNCHFRYFPGVFFLIGKVVCLKNGNSMISFRRRH